MTTLVKICGLSAPETLGVALDAGADFVGLVFFPKSPRNVTIRQAAQLAEQARGRAKIVTLVVDADDTLVDAIATSVTPDLIQAHGTESPERISAIHARAGIPVYKVIKVRSAADVETAKAYRAVSPFIMYDAAAPAGSGLPGGNGLTFDWKMLKAAPLPFMLAGGLTPENVALAIATTQAAMVDVSSGVEAAPGVKDANLIRKFIEAAKATG